ncbi:MAG: hypothetical protein IIC39_09060 [Candidatus Marinimicrobia bacterium]|nr:hypothetical protein [Candidatus Neomarinimicrobiota bacterium]
MGLRLSLFVYSAAVLSAQVALMRIFSVTQWHHFSYMIISVALLGFGASGAFISLFRERLLASFTLYYRLFGALLAITFPAAIFLSQLVPFEPFLLVWDANQYIYLFAHYLLLLVPFFSGAMCIGLLFSREHRRIGNLYFVNLIGSATGTLLIVPLMFILPVEQLPIAVSALSIIGVAATYTLGKRKEWAYILIPLFGIWITYSMVSPFELNISEYKGLSRSLELPGARSIYESDSPLGRLSVVESPVIRIAPGLSTAFTGTIPPQKALHFDAASPTAIIEWDGISSPPEYLDYLPEAAPYSVISKPDVLIIGLGGGRHLLRALKHESNSVTVIERDRRLVNLFDDNLARFTGRLTALDAVRIIISDGRRFIKTDSSKYDLIEISALGSFAAASSGVSALSETYLFTVEAIVDGLRLLKPGGMISLTAWLKHPPRDNLKLLATAAEALEEEGLRYIGRNVFFFRGWGTATILIKREEFTETEIEKLKEFCENLFFDVIHYPGINRTEVNRYNRFSEPVYFQAAAEILSNAHRREDFYASYPFDVSPARDGKPYFNHLFKLTAIPHLYRTLGVEWIPFIEWGYIILFATLVQALIASTVLILIPLRFLNHSTVVIRRVRKLKIWIYFSSIGLAYMFVEIVFTQKFTLFLAEPVYSVSVTLASLLFWSGMGSYFSGEIKKRIPNAFLIPALAAVVIITEIALLDHVFDAAFHLSLGWRVIIAIVIIAPLGFAMGIPFPIGLKALGESAENYVPWAWGINGCASVIGAVLAMTLSVSFGFSAVLMAAAGMYIVAGLSGLITGD